MAVVNGYATPADLRARFNLDAGDNDPLLINAINAASRMIDGYCKRSFYDAASTPSARSFYAQDCETVKVDDFHTTTGLQVKVDSADNGTFDVTWAATDYQAEPLNGVSDGLTVPYNRLRAVGTRRFLSGGRRPRVQVTARWGWAAPPDAVVDACMIQAARLFRRKDTPDGIAGFGDFGVTRISTRLDPDVEHLLAPFVRPTVL